MNKLHIAILSLLTALLVACGSDSSESKDQNATNSKALKVAVMPTAECLPLYVACEARLDSVLDCPLQLVRFASLLDCDSAMIGGSAVAVVTDDAHTSRLHSLGLTLHEEENPNAIMTAIGNHRARIKDAQQLKDKMIAVGRNSAEQRMARHLLDSVKLDGDKAFIVMINDVNLRLHMLETNEMDAVVLPEPYASAALSQGHHRLQAATTAVTGRLAVTLANSRSKKAPKATQQQVDKIVKLYNQACDSINKNGVHAYDSLLIKRMGIAPQYVKTMPAVKYKHLSPCKKS